MSKKCLLREAVKTVGFMNILGKSKQIETTTDNNKKTKNIHIFSIDRRHSPSTIDQY
jgi:hypothetical protein